MHRYLTSSRAPCSANEPKTKAHTGHLAARGGSPIFELDDWFSCLRLSGLAHPLGHHTIVQGISIGLSASRAVATAIFSVEPYLFCVSCWHLSSTFQARKIRRWGCPQGKRKAEGGQFLNPLVVPIIDKHLLIGS